MLVTRPVVERAGAAPRVRADRRGEAQGVQRVRPRSSSPGSGRRSDDLSRAGPGERAAGAPARRWSCCSRAGVTRSACSTWPSGSPAPGGPGAARQLRAARRGRGRRAHCPSSASGSGCSSTVAARRRAPGRATCRPGRAGRPLRGRRRAGRGARGRHRHRPHRHRPGRDDPLPPGLLAQPAGAARHAPARRRARPAAAPVHARGDRRHCRDAGCTWREDSRTPTSRLRARADPARARAGAASGPSRGRGQRAARRRVLRDEAEVLDGSSIAVLSAAARSPRARCASWPRPRNGSSSSAWPTRPPAGPRPARPAAPTEVAAPRTQDGLARPAARRAGRS